MSSLGINAITAQAIQVLYDDPERVVDVTLLRVTTSWDGQKNVDAEKTWPCKAINLKHTFKSVQQSRTPGIQIGDEVFLIRFAEAPEGINVNDFLVYNGERLNIRPVDWILDLAYVVTVIRG